PSFTELLGRVRETTLSAYEHQDVPFEKVVERVVKHRDMSRSPLFGVIFSLQNVEEVATDRFNELYSAPFEVKHVTSQFDMIFNCSYSEGQIFVKIEYSTDLFRSQSIENLFDSYHELLCSLISNPLWKISQLQLLSHKAALRLREFNDTSYAYEKEKQLVELFTDQVDCNPGSIALNYQNKTLTYLQLDERSNQVARMLPSYGVKPGSNIGLLSDRGLEMIVGILGILKSGCAYVPLNIEFPIERLRYMLLDSQVEIVLTTKLAAVDLYELSKFTLVDIEQSLSYPSERIQILSHMSARLNVMYTSGTTGRPKGIAVSQQNVIKLIEEPGEIQILQSDRVLQWSNYGFDGSSYEIFSTLMNGACLVLIEDEAVADVFRLAEQVIEKQVSVMFLTTALFNSFVDAHLEAFGGVRKILFGGEAVSSNHVLKAFNNLGPGKLIHVYGPTETTVFASSYPVNQVSELENIPIGKPLANTRIWILDPHFKQVPVGAIGEMFISGDGVAIGYVGDAHQSENRFLNQLGDRLYRTGDLGRWLPDGNIEYVGRMDDQVKVRGYRIELGEVESVLQTA
ncbi:MAG: amino acid adenylation domain-containing protein, partial [Marinoscillum sp.]